MTPAWRLGWNRALGLEMLWRGSQFADGRWHEAALRMPVVYAASSRALCQLEKRVHCNGVAPADLALLRLELPAGAQLMHAQELGLQPDWRADPAHTRGLGTAWCARRSSLGLWVPSYVEPAESNLVLNALHPLYEQVRVVVELDPFRFEPRLFA